MKTRVFAVQDVVANQFLHPFLAPAPGVAIRMFGDSVRDPATPMGKHPGDFRLAEIGSFDDETGAFFPAPPEFLSRGSDFSEAPGLRAVS